MKELETLEDLKKKLEDQLVKIHITVDELYQQIEVLNFKIEQEKASKNSPEKDGWQGLDKPARRANTQPTPASDGWKPLDQPFKPKPLFIPTIWPVINICKQCGWSEGVGGECLNPQCSRNQTWRLKPWNPIDPWTNHNITTKVEYGNTTRCACGVNANCQCDPPTSNTV